MGPFSGRLTQLWLPYSFINRVAKCLEMSLSTTDLLHIGWITQLNYVIKCQLDICIHPGEIWIKGEHQVTYKLSQKLNWSNSTNFVSQIWAKQTLDWPYHVWYIDTYFDYIDTWILIFIHSLTAVD